MIFWFYKPSRRRPQFLGKVPFSPIPRGPQLLVRLASRNLSTDLYGRVQDIVRKQGLFDVRLNEKDVSLFGGVPERLLVLMHEEMYQPALNLGMVGGLGAFGSRCFGLVLGLDVKGFVGCCIVFWARA